MKQILSEQFIRMQKLAGIMLNENKTLNHRGAKGSQELIVPNNLGNDVDSDDFYTALEFAIDGEMSGRDYQEGVEYRLFVADQSRQDPTKEVFFKFKKQGDGLQVDPSSIKVEVVESLLNEQLFRMQKLAGLLTESQYHTLLNEDLSQEVQALVDKNEYLKGKVEAIPSDMIEGSEYVLLFSDEAAKHIIERHLDGNKPGSLFKSGINLKDVAKKIINTTPTTTDGGRVKWLSVNAGNVGEMGVAKTTPEEVAKMKDYTMPDGARETVKILGGRRKPTSEVSLITADLGTLDDGRKALSLITMFPGGMEVDGVEIPMDRSKFASEGFYFVVDPSSPLLK